MRSSLARFIEIRRALPLLAAVLLIAALLIPVWEITLTAPQYPGDPMIIELYVYPHLSGDFVEIQGLNKYAGFYFPDPVYVEPNYDVHEKAIDTPEWVLGPVVYLLLALTGIFVSLAPTVRKLKMGLMAQFAGTTSVFLGMFILIQYRLYQAGHTLDPDAPLRGIEGFTPPLLGSYEVANISGFAWFGSGGYMTIAAIGLLAIAYLARDTEATVLDLPALLRTIPETIRERVTHRRQRGDHHDDRPNGTEDREDHA